MGFAHVACVSGGSVYGWGRGTRGQLGTGPFPAIFTAKPQLIPLTSRVGPAIVSPKATQVSCGFGNTVALTEDGQLYLWGKRQAKTIAKDTSFNADQLYPR